jgi:plastocyanin
MRIVTLLTAALLVLAASCSSEPTGSEGLCPDPTTTTTTSVEMGDFFYEPECVEVDEGATLSIDNTGKAPHTFTIDGAEANVAAGESATLDLANIAPGTYEVICTYHPQMTAALRVR